MGINLSHEMEKGLVALVNERYDYGFDLEEDYQKVTMNVFNESILTDVLTKCKFEDIGNIFDFPEDLPQQHEIDAFSLSVNFDMFERIAVSKKFEAVAYFTIDRYMINCVFLVDSGYLKKLSKIIHKISQRDVGSNIFQGIDFECKKGEYIEVGESTGDSMKPADVGKKKIPKENVVFDVKDTLTEVINDIGTFFTEKTQKQYEKMEIAYKRGIMLFGDPGNGKSTTIRKIIREVPDVTKIVINPNVRRVTKILAVLMKSLNGRRAIIIIEDIDSLITDSNRSEFLNILDGVDIKSGVFFIGTTNYPDKIDPAFMNRSGRFDRMYKIENPSEAARRLFFKSRKIDDLLDEYQVHKDESIPDKGKDVIEMFTKFSDGFPMATLKELMISTQYTLASNPDMSIEEALEISAARINENRKEHAEMHNEFKAKARRGNGSFGNPTIDDYDDEDDDD